MDIVLIWLSLTFTCVVNCRKRGFFCFWHFSKTFFDILFSKMMPNFWWCLWKSNKKVFVFYWFFFYNLLLYVRNTPNWVHTNTYYQTKLPSFLIELEIKLWCHDFHFCLLISLVFNDWSKACWAWLNQWKFSTTRWCQM